MQKELKYIRKSTFRDRDNPIPYFDFDLLYKYLNEESEFIQLVNRRREELKRIREEIFRLEALSD